MKFMKVSVVVAGILLITSGLISCVADGTRPSSSSIENPTTAGCSNKGILGSDFDDTVPEPSASHSSEQQSTKAPIQKSADCSNLDELI
jgi:hypothetical protein